MRAHPIELEFLEDRIGVYEDLVQGLVLIRPTYVVAMAVIKRRSKGFRFVVRGTNEDWFEGGDFDTWGEVTAAIAENERRFKLNGAYNGARAEIAAARAELDRVQRKRPLQSCELTPEEATARRLMYGVLTSSTRDEIRNYIARRRT